MAYAAVKGNQANSSSSTFTPSQLAARLRNFAAVIGHPSHVFGRLHQTRCANQPNPTTAEPEMKTVCLEDYQRQIQERDEVITHLRKQVAFKDDQIAYLASELDKYQSVFNQKPSVLRMSRSCRHKVGVCGGKGDPDGCTRKRGIGISAEPQVLKLDEKEHPKHYPKTAKTREILNQAILENDFMRNLDTTQVVELVECMYSVNFASGNTIIREGELGSVVYVMEGESMAVRLMPWSK
uniref:Cyclic nucleotide-binding domain-containing protein n=1 Tax=Mesocestoides corti TaxID=53468 RepID=A0A5K3FFP6_MESCO